MTFSQRRKLVAQNFGCLKAKIIHNQNKLFLANRRTFYAAFCGVFCYLIKTY